MRPPAPVRVQAVFHFSNQKEEVVVINGTVMVLVEVGRKVVVRVKGSPAMIVAVGLASATLITATRIGRRAHETFKTIL